MNDEKTPINLKDIHVSLDEFFEPYKILQEDAVKKTYENFMQKCEKNLLEFMTEHRTTKAYVIQQIVPFADECKIECRMYFFADKDEALETCKKTGEFTTFHDLTKLVEMSDEEFERTALMPNYEYAKKFRETMRNK